jgi:carbon-monoxide dehydrogenase large subunit/6-hydroxypseudooxynicotine dehydrogenase subunit gamma
MRVVRSPIAHARLDNVDLAEARAMPGVVAAFSANDIIDALGELPRIHLRIGALVDPDPWLQPVLATDRVRYVGEPVAVVVAADPYTAEDAADVVTYDLDPLPAVSESRRAHDGPELFEAGNEVQTINASLGEGAAIFDRAPIVVEAHLAVGRHTAIPMETRGLLAIPRDGRLHVYGSAKVLHWNRGELARQLSIDPSSLRYVECAIGGSFGVRGEFYPEDFLVPFAARLLGRPVRWLEDRWEHFVATNHGRDQVHLAAIAGTEEGDILGLRSEFWADLGAYVRTNGLRVPEITAGMLPGPYRVPNFQAVGHCVVTNRTPTGTYRGPGRVESTFVRERLVDLFAQRIGLDPVEVRRRNLISPGDQPLDRQTFSTAPRVQLVNDDFVPLFEQVVGAIDQDAIERRRAAGELVGAGAAVFLERSGTGPPVEFASAQLDEHGDVTVRTGASSVGQGLHTAVAALVGRELGIDVTRVRSVALDTDELGQGTGSFGSRSTLMAGNAAVQAARQLVEAARPIAARLLQIGEAELSYSQGRYQTDGGDRQVDLGEVAKQANITGELSLLRADACFTSEGPNSDFGVHAAQVRIDADSGHITVERLVIGFDAGPAVVREQLEGQLLGAAVQGLGGALLEHLSYDEEANPTATSFLDYHLPTIAETPPIDLVVGSHPSSTNPLGLRGVGEGGITGVPAAIAAAVGDAVGDHGAVSAVPLRLDAVHAALERAVSRREGSR